MTGKRRQRKTLNDWIDEQRRQLGLSWDELARAAGVSKQTLINIRNGADAYPKTIRNLEAALGWVLGSIAAIKEGGEPTVATDPLAQPLPAFAAPAADDDPALQLRALYRRMGATAFWREIDVIEREEKEHSR